MQNKPADDPIGDWERALGRYVMDFTQVEYWLHVYVHALGSPELHRESIGDTFTQRVDRISRLLASRSLPPQTTALASEVLADAKALARKRNLILHNPMLVDIYQKPDGALHYEMNVRSLRDGTKSIDLAGVRDECAFAKGIGERLAELIRQVDTSLR